MIEIEKFRRGRARVLFNKKTVGEACERSGGLMTVRIHIRPFTYNILKCTREHALLALAAPVSDMLTWCEGDMHENIKSDDFPRYLVGHLNLSSLEVNKLPIGLKFWVLKTICAARQHALAEVIHTLPMCASRSPQEILEDTHKYTMGCDDEANISIEGAAGDLHRFATKIIFDPSMHVGAKLTLKTFQPPMSIGGGGLGELVELTRKQQQIADFIRNWQASFARHIKSQEAWRRAADQWIMELRMTNDELNAHRER